MPRQRRAQAPSARRVQRVAFGKLRENRVSKRQAERYRVHAIWFVQWLQLHHFSPAKSWVELNEQLMNYIEMLWDTDCELEVCGQFLLDILYFLMAQGKLSGAWPLFGVWKMQEPPCRAALMPR